MDSAERLINRVMRKGAEPALLVTFGLSIIIQDALLLLFTADARHAGGAYSSIVFRIGSISIALLDIILLVISLLSIAILTWFLSKTYMGRSIRATSDDTEAASLMGVNVNRTYGIAMGIAMATAALPVSHRFEMDLLSELRRWLSADSIQLLLAVWDRFRERWLPV